MTPEILVYSSGFCPYCVRARRFLESKGLKFTEKRVDGDNTLREEMETRSGRRSVPQIFIGGTHVGGFDDMWELDRAGELDRMLGLT